MSGHDIVVIGASAGGVEALTRIVANLPHDLPAAIFVVLHVPPHASSVLPSILARRGPLPARHALNGEVIREGVVYIAPPDRHLLLGDGVIRISHGPHENGHRPAIDPLFRSAARRFGPRVIGVVLSGALDDGTAGLASIKRAGGVALVQDPDDALYPGMPRSALELVTVDQTLPATALGSAIVALIHTPAPEGLSPSDEEEDAEDRLMDLDMDIMHIETHPGHPSAFGCPNCGGVLWEMHDPSILRFRCRVGHAWTADSLAATMGEALEEALWSALRALEEKAELVGRLADRARQSGHLLATQRFSEQAAEVQSRAKVIRDVLHNGGSMLFDAETADSEPLSVAETGSGG